MSDDAVPVVVGEYPAEDVALGSRIRAAREALSLSQREVAGQLAERLGEPFAQSQVWRIEQGIRAVSWREYQHLADILGGLEGGRGPRPWSPTVPRVVLTTICHMLGVDPDRVSRISIYPDSIEIVDERSVVGRLDGTP